MCLSINNRFVKPDEPAARYPGDPASEFEAAEFGEEVGRRAPGSGRQIVHRVGFGGRHGPL
jgi:hypothetical protein